MALVHELEMSGNWLFKRRGWLPLLLVIPALLLIYFSKGEKLQFNLTREMIFLGISFCGQIIRAFTVGYTPRGTSGRNIKGQVAEQLNVTGIYSILRHPLYTGNFLMWLGAVLFVRSIWFTAVFILLYWIYYERIMFAEEQFLRRKFGAVYDEWSRKVKPLVPYFGNYLKPELLFSFRNVLKREYNSFGSLFMIFALFDLIRNFTLSEKLLLTPIWLYMTIFGVCFWLIIRLLRKRTKILNVKGR